MNLRSSTGLRVIGKLLPILALAAMSACASLRDHHTAANPAIVFTQERVQAVAMDLVRSGRAANMEEALPMAEKIVRDEVDAQKDVGLESDNRDKFYRPDHDKRAEGGND